MRKIEINLSAICSFSFCIFFLIFNFFFHAISRRRSNNLTLNSCRFESENPSQICYSTPSSSLDHSRRSEWSPSMVLVSAVRDYINRMLQDISGMKVLILDSHTVSSFPNTPLFISLFNFISTLYLDFGFLES